ncbi:hypothetical protein [Tepidibacter formicigenes]|jgi:hypothetical protein|uniref:Uncharacterized protein n=1 Tax=Tepidibacter formicigenes DSM 15518 TaxID=1123349 RepID=A0A1M6N9L1_9FIRM|nr:hypothetical protein [Tepidibacter formicigenes]SHJ92363.1 hypothetical protein SAMN02744037_01196 [Tepidibacter formicigenes DSM 15518]
MNIDVETIFQILNTVILICILYFLFTFVFKIPKKIYSYLNDLDQRESYRKYKRP